MEQPAMNQAWPIEYKNNVKVYLQCIPVQQPFKESNFSCSAAHTLPEWRNYCVHIWYTWQSKCDAKGN